MPFLVNNMKIISDMDPRDPDYVPIGWVKTSRNNRTVFLTSMPERLIVQGKMMLIDYQKKGRFLEVDSDKLDFRVVKVNDAKNREVLESVEDMEVDEIEGNALAEPPEHCAVDLKATEEQTDLIISATKRLQLDTENPVDHDAELKTASEILRHVMESSSNLETLSDLEGLKESLGKARTDEDFIEILKSNVQVYDYFSKVMKAKLLSEMINLPLNPSSPLVGWPVNINENVYVEVIKLANAKASEVLSFICSVILPKDQQIGNEDVIRVADLFSTLAHTVSKNQNALAKLKSIVLQSEGLSASGLDRSARLKGTESSSSLSRGRHLMVDLCESSFKSRVKDGKSFTLICDNLNLKQQNMTQSVIHIDDVATDDLSNEPIDPNLLPELFDPQKFLLGSNENKALLQHVEYAAAVRLGNILGDIEPEASKLKRFLPHAHKHGRSHEVKVQSEIFIPPPDYLNEADNAEFFEFCMKKEAEFLDAVAESVEYKEEFMKDLDLVKCKKVIESGILESEEDVKARESAESRVLDKVKQFGHWIGFGDALTFKQFWLGAKAIAHGNCTAFERLDFLPHFRLALFHAKMNKCYMDFPVLMPKKAMMEDEGTLPELVAIAGIQGISIEEKKISNSFEKHDQLLMLTGHLYLANMFRNFVKEDHKAMDGIVNEATAVEFVQSMMDKYDIELYFNPERVVPEDKWDDPSNYARDAVARMILSEMFDAGEEEEDWFLLKGLRLIMVVYFLNRKYKIQDSKYAAFLMLDEVFERQASERDKERMNRAVCVNPSGKKGGGLFAYVFNKIIMSHLTLNILQGQVH